MNISFSTICPNNAKKYLFESGKYDYLSIPAREYVMKNLGDIRVQDPMMYPSPCLELTSREHYDNVMALNSMTKEQVESE